MGFAQARICQRVTRIDFESPADMRPAIAGRPVYLAMAMNADGVLKLKPQNLLLNLPLARPP